jgi:hypothetical protein
MVNDLTDPHEEQRQSMRCTCSNTRSALQTRQKRLCVAALGLFFRLRKAICHTAHANLFFHNV